MLISQPIKEYRFPNRSVSTANPSTIYTVHPINGEIVKVVVQTNAAGSLFILESGTSEPIVNGNGFVSGTAPTIMYPRVLVTNNINTDLSGLSSNVWDKRTTNTVLSYAGSGFTSGTNAAFSGISVYYQ